MRILTISADYPPYHSGGYGIRIKNIMDGLFAKGYEISILTTKAQSLKNEVNVELAYPIHRVLHDRCRVRSFPKEILIDIQDIKTLDKAIQQFLPNLIYLGHIFPLTKQLLPFLSTQNIPILCDEGGNSLKGAWTDHGRWFRFTGDYQPRVRWLNKLKPVVVQAVKLLSRGRIREEWGWPDGLSVIFNSKKNQSFVMGLGVPVRHSQVIYSGIDTDIFTFQEQKYKNLPLRIICPGRIEPRKGQLDAIRLMTILKNHNFPASLIIVGEVVSLDYKQRILEEIKQSKLEEQIQLLPMISQEELARLYHQSDFCFFPSHQESGLSRIPLEAMACGCIVVSYGNEGSDEIIENEVNGYCVEPGNVKKVEEIIRALDSSPAKVEEVRSSALRGILEKYNLPSYIEKIEAFIQQSF